MIALTGKTMDRTRRDLRMWLRRATMPFQRYGRPVSAQDGIEHTRRLLERLRYRQAAGIATTSVARLRLLLAVQSSQRLKMGLVGLLLLDAFCAYILLLHLLTALTASPLSPSQPPNDTGLAFLTIVVLPAVLLALRLRHKRARAREQAQESAARRRTRHTATDLARAYAVLYLQPGAPLEIAQAAYTAAMKRVHPDLTGGDTTAAAELNWAIATIRDHARIQDPPR